MEIKVKFKVGDEVYGIERNYHTKRPEIKHIGTVKEIFITEEGIRYYVNPVFGSINEYGEHELLLLEEAEKSLKETYIAYIEELKAEIEWVEKELNHA